MRWTTGDQITWTYRNPRHPHVRTLRPATVVLDDERGTVVWIAGGTPVLLPALADGKPLRSAGVHKMFTEPRIQTRQHWKGGGILMIALPDKPYSVWLFFKDNGSFGCYYVNIETPHERTDEGIVAEDLVLDIIVLPRGTWRYKDEHELIGAQEAGTFDIARVELIRAYGREAVADIEARNYPFSAGYTSFFPDPSWPIPDLPAGTTWDLDRL